MASVSFSGGSIRLLKVVSVSLILMCSASPGKNFRGRATESERMVTTQDIESSLRASLEAVLRGGNDEAARQLDRIESSMWQTFQALPKNSMGRLEPRSVRHIVHNYFAKEHGWLINGLEPDTMQFAVSELHEVSILQDKAPVFVEGLLEARRAGHGLSLADVVVMAAALERLIFDESIYLLAASYSLNGYDADDMVDEGALQEILTSYLMVFEMGLKGNVSDIALHKKIKAKLAAKSPSWPTTVEFAQDAVNNFLYASQAQMNPFAVQHISFEVASQIVENLAQGYGKWQNTECRQMKEHLMDLDADGSGRVTLDAFYSQQGSIEYQFTESVDYLRQIGALDEPPRGKPKVRIANYVAGPSNCIASSTYYSVCCLNDCESLRNELEGAIQDSVATTKRVLAVVGNMSSFSVDAPRDLPATLVDKLQAIADRNGGMVPLHGRLFSQWMHYAFPNECPYPLMSQSSDALSPGHWVDSRGTATDEEKKFHIESAMSDEFEVEHPISQWTDDEVLHLHSSQRLGAGTWGSAVRAIVQLAMLCVVLRIAGSMWRSTVDKTTKGRDKRASDGFELPFRL